MENRQGPVGKTKRMAGQAVQNAGNGVMGIINKIDDSTQAFARNQLLQLPTDGSRLDQDAMLGGLRHALGKTVFRSRSGYEGDATQYRGSGTTNDNIGVGLSRALQGGGVTAAGAGLAALAGQFGGPADTPEPAQLPLN